MESGKIESLFILIYFIVTLRAIAAREAARQLTVLGYEIAVFTHDKQT
ncbi:MAG: hypothetical protein IPO94_17625 [Saprospiraceae bacterium]|nr:hypothetical protein [Saprospiraceae bacterium]